MGGFWPVGGSSRRAMPRTHAAPAPNRAPATPSPMGTSVVYIIVELILNFRSRVDVDFEPHPPPHPNFCAATVACLRLGSVLKHSIPRRMSKACGRSPLARKYAQVAIWNGADDDHAREAQPRRARPPAPGWAPEMPSRDGRRSEPRPRPTRKRRTRGRGPSHPHAVRANPSETLFSTARILGPKTSWFRAVVQHPADQWLSSYHFENGIRQA